MTKWGLQRRSTRLLSSFYARKVAGRRPTSPKGWVWRGPYLNNLLSGRKASWPDNLKEKVSRIYGYSVAELLLLGEAYLRTGIWFPHAHKLVHLAPRSLERAEAIYRAAAEDVGIGMSHVVFSRDTITLITPRQVKEYQEGTMSDAALYDFAHGLCIKICPQRKSC